MSQQLDFLKCYYRPAFFQIKIDLSVELGNLNDVTDSTFSLYLHEYIHFIQDISTIYGLINISTINYYIQDCAARIHQQAEKEFKVPLQLYERPGDFGYLNHSLQPIYIGSSINPKRKKIDFISYKIEKQLFSKGKYIDTVNLRLKDKIDHKIFEVKLGGNLITEGMAYLSERYVYYEILQEQGVEIPADEYPYCVAEKIAEDIYPELAQYKILIIAVCDCSLMTYHPGLSFIRALEFLKQENFIENNQEEKEIISLLYQKVSLHLKGKHFDFDVIVEQVRNSIKKSFKVEHFEGNNQWIDILFDRIKQIRGNRPEFVTDFLQLGNLKSNELFGYFFRLFGSPLVLNGENIATIALPEKFNPENFHPYLFWAINQILKIFTNQKATPCELKNFCQKSKEINDPKIIVDERCDRAPWEKYDDVSLCPVGTMWKHWGLSEFYPGIQKSK